MTSRATHASGLEPLRRRIAQAPYLSAEEEQRLAKLARDGGARELAQLVDAHLRLVFSIAEEFGRYGLPMDELVSEGLLGLVEAARRFDPERGARLSTYAAWWIRAYLRRYTLANRRIVRPPSSRNARKVLAHLRKAQRELSQSSGGRADPVAVAQKLGVPVRDVEEIDSVLARRDVSCDADSASAGYEPVSGAPSPEAVVSDLEMQRRRSDMITLALDTLSVRERHVIAQRALCAAPTSLEAIGSQMGLSRERVRQIQQQGFAKMRNVLDASVA